MIVRSRGHEVWLLLNHLFADSETELREKYEKILPSDRIVSFSGLRGVAHNRGSNHWRIRAAEKLRDQAVRLICPDVVHTTSVFEGLDEDAIISIDTGAARHTATIYDLIPYTYSDVYLQNEITRNWYYRRLQQLVTSDTLLAISEFTRLEAIERLHLSPDQVFNISAGVDPSFKKIDLADAEKSELRFRYKLFRSFVMYTGGVDFRKNIEGLIRSFSALPEELKRTRQLAIVCAISASEKLKLEALGRSVGLTSEDLILTGFVPHTDLIGLYNICEVFVFPSISEGFGLPVLEAMACGAPVIGSFCSSIPEVIGFQDALFDPNKDASITSKMAQVLENPDLQRTLKEHGQCQSKRFTWERSADLAFDALEYSLSSKLATRSARRKKLAFVSPMPPAKSGIASYSNELLPVLAKYYDIDIITEQTHISEPWLVANYPRHDPDWLIDNAYLFDRVIYQMGNSSYHAFMFDLISKVPGIVVLHDFYLSGAIGWMDSTGRTSGFLENQLFASHGFKPLVSEDTIMKFPANKRVIDSALGVIVHSDHSLNLADYWYGQGHKENWRVVPQIRVPSPNTQRANAKRILGYSQDAFIVCCFGIIDATKRNDLLLEAFIRSELAKSRSCHLIMVGESSGAPYLANLQRIAQSSIAASRISFTGFVDASKFDLYLNAADIAVQLRQSSRGESSRTALDAMSAGVPLIVNSCGSMKELPDHCVVKLPEDVSIQDLTLAIEMLWLDTDERVNRSLAARKHVGKSHHPQYVGERYFEATESIYCFGSKSRRLSVISDLLRTTGATPNLDDVSEVAAALMPKDHERERVLVDLTFVDMPKISSIQKEMIKACILDVCDAVRVEVISHASGEVTSIARDAYGHIVGRRLNLTEDVIECSGCQKIFVLDPPADQIEDLIIRFRSATVTLIFSSHEGLLSALPILEAESGLEAVMALIVGHSDEPRLRLSNSPAAPRLRYIDVKYDESCQILTTNVQRL